MTIIHSLTMKNKWITQRPVLVVVAQPDVTQLCGTTLQTHAARPAFGMRAGRDGPHSLLQVRWVLLQWSASRRTPFIRALVYANYSHPLMFFKSTDYQRNQNTHFFFWIILEFLLNQHFFFSYHLLFHFFITFFISLSAAAVT